MMTRLRQFFAPPTFVDEETSRIARLAHMIILTMLFAASLAGLIILFTGLHIHAYALWVGAVLMVGSLVMVRNGRIQFALFVVIIAMLGVVTFLTFNGLGMHDTAILIYPVMIIVASLLMGKRGFVTVIVLTILVVGITFLFEESGIIQTPYPEATTLSDFFIVSIALVATAITVRLLSNNMLQNLERARHNEHALAEINRKLGEQTVALGASEALYRQAIEVAGAVPYYQDYEKDAYTFMGKGIVNLTGYSPEEMTPDLWDSLVQEMTLLGQAAGLPVKEAIEKARKGEIQMWKSDMRIQSRYGQVRWVTDSAVEVLDEKNNSHGSIGILQDITERKQAEILQTVLYEVAEAVHTSTDLSELFRSIHGTLGKLMDVRNFYIALCSPGNPNLFSFPYTVDEYDTFKPVEDLTGSLTAYVVRTGQAVLITPNKHQELIQAGEVSMIGVPSAAWLGVPLKIGEKVIGVAVLQNYTNPHLYTEYHIELMSFVCTQIALATERKLAAEALQVNEARFRTLIENSNDMVMILEQDGTLRYASPSISHVMGYRTGDMVGKKIFDFIHPQDIDRLKAEWAQIILASDEPQTTEARIRHADGTWHIHEGVGRNLFQDPAVMGFVLNTRDITERKQAQNDLLSAHQNLRIAYEATIEGWSRVMDLRDKETEGHTKRVTELTLRLAELVGIPKAELQHIRRGALLHDIGKMGVSDNILQKSGPLTEAEWIEMRKHPVYAYQMLSPIQYLRPALDIPYHHHEKWDGTGYPKGLRGEEIPLAARLFAIVDVWDALRSDRPYRKRLRDDDVVSYIREQSGLHFDPRLVDVFMKLMAFDEPPSSH